MITNDAIHKFKNKLGYFDWANLCNSNDVNYCYDGFIHEFSILYDECFSVVPDKNKIKRKVYKQPWITNGLYNINQKKA